MKLNSYVVRYVAAAILVMILGGLLGWYVFVHQQISSTDTLDAARGFGGSSSFGGETGSAFENLIGGITGAIAGGDEERKAAPRLWQITRTPVAGHGFASTSPRLYFAERASGNILIADPHTSKIERLTNTLFPRVVEAIFAVDGSVVLRSIGENGEILSYAGRIATSTSPAAGDTPMKLEGVLLPQDIVSIAARSNPNELFFIAKEQAGGSSGVTSDWGGGGQKRLLVSKLSDWTALLLEDGTKYVVQKPADDVAGFAFKLLGSGSLERYIGDVAGLMILPKSGSSAMLYSSVSGGAYSLFGRTSDKSTYTRFPVRTRADKCVWSRDARLIVYCAVPGTQGANLKGSFDGSEHTLDSWWRIDVSANTAEQIYVPDSSVALDVENPRIDPTGTYIAFMNTADKTLWMLTIEK